MDTLSALNLLTSILGFIVAGILVFSPSQNRLVNRFLGVAFCCMAYRSLNIFALDQHLISNNYLMGSLSFAYYFSQPAMFFYLRSMIKDEQSIRKTDWVHLLIPGAAVLLLLYYIVMGFVYHGTFVLPPDQTVFNEEHYYPFYILPKYHVLAMFVVSFFYLGWSWKLVIQKMRKRKKEHPQFTKMRNWLLTLQIVCTAILLVVLYNALLVIVFKTEVNFIVDPDTFRSFVLIFLMTRILIKPDLLFGLPGIKTVLPVVDEIPQIIEAQPKALVHENVSEDHEAISVISEPEPERSLYFDEYGWVHYGTGSTEIPQEDAEAPIEMDKVILYIEKIKAYLATDPYINQDFDMKMISAELDCPLYHIEYLFRYYNRYTFSEFRNVLRVQYVLKDFESGLHQDYTMEAVGLKAGFNSRSSFFRVFKTVMGTTPKQFLGSQDMDAENA